jgi:hypothetical protein
VEASKTLQGNFWLAEDEKMGIMWHRDRSEINFRKPNLWVTVGAKESGKSVLLERVGEECALEDACIFDLSGARDGEGLAQLRNPRINGKNVLLLHGDNVQVNAPHADCKPATKFRKDDLMSYDLIISSNPLYENYREEFIRLATITDEIFTIRYVRRLIYGIVREASNLYASRIFIGEDQNMAKAVMTYLLREARHTGLAMGIDSLRWTAIDVDIRELSDHDVFKALGHAKSDDTKSYIFKYVNPDKLRRLDPATFVIDTYKTGIGTGQCAMIPWHKEPEEDILTLCNLDIYYDQEEKNDPDKSPKPASQQPKQIGAFQHCEIMRLYIEGQNDVDGAMGMNHIATLIERSSKSVWQHIIDHNISVKALTACPVCRRANGKYATFFLERGKATPAREFTMPSPTTKPVEPLKE